MGLIGFYLPMCGLKCYTSLTGQRLVRTKYPLASRRDEPCCSGRRERAKALSLLCFHITHFHVRSNLILPRTSDSFGLGEMGHQSRDVVEYRNVVIAGTRFLQVGTCRFAG